MKKNICLLVCIIAFLVGLTPFAQAAVSIDEFFDPATQEGFYDVTVGSEMVVAFAVGNNTATGTDTDRDDWDSEVVPQSSWDTYVALLNLPSTFEFEAIFGAGVTQAAAYWDEGLEDFFNPIPIDPLGPAESDNRFTWTGTLPASNYVVFTLDDQGNIDDTPILGTTTVVPEPISTTLFIAGGLTLGFRRYWKKKRMG